MEAGQTVSASVAKWQGSSAIGFAGGKRGRGTRLQGPRVQKLRHVSWLKGPKEASHLTDRPPLPKSDGKSFESTLAASKLSQRFFVGFLGLQKDTP